MPARLTDMSCREKLLTVLITGLMGLAMFAVLAGGAWLLTP